MLEEEEKEEEDEEDDDEEGVAYPVSKPSKPTNVYPLHQQVNE